MSPRWHLIKVAFLAVILAAVESQSAERVAKVEFNRDIRPILSDHCFRCHGPDKSNRKAKLRLDVRDEAIKKEAFIPGKPEESELIRRITATNEDDLMPPTDMHKPLSARQKKLLHAWIAQGAEYQPHWAYITPKRPAVPSIQNSKAKIQNPIDAFILRELEKRKISPSPEADRRTLLRRLSLDLVGLPPTPEEVSAFVNDKSPNAYEKQVKRLLASPHYGERMAAPWLDLARYADTVGYHGDQNQNIFPYRDYVINSFNANKPFDQFTIEQLAGDLLPNPTVEQKTATAFNRLNMMTREGGAQPKEYMAKYAADRVRTVSTTWLGSTMACCECHDHKYDPFSAKDFYSLAAFFADLKQWGVYADYGYTPNPDLKGFANEHPFPPEMEVESPTLQRRIKKLTGQLADTQAEAWEKLEAVKASRAAFDEWRKESRAFLKNSPDGWLTPFPTVALRLKDTNAVVTTNYSVRADGTISFSSLPHQSTTIEVSLTNGWLGAIRVEVFPQEKPASGKVKMVKKKLRTFNDISFAAKLTTSKGESKLPIYFADAHDKIPEYSQGQEILGVKQLWRVSDDKEQQAGVWVLEKPQRITEPTTLSLSLGPADVASLRVSVTPFVAHDVLRSGGDPELAKAIKGFGKPARIQEAYLLSTGTSPEFLVRSRKMQQEIRECRGGRAFVQVTEHREPVTMRVLPRGNWQDDSGEIVQPVPPHFLSQAENNTTNRETRLDLARWLTSPENPLTARTFVNRLWKDFFGTGLSAVVDDLGAQGEWPTHPELLDWLAVEFRASGWNVKHIVQLMVTSQTYRQVAGPRPDLKDIDPNNRLLAAQSPRRLDAEYVRDNALAVAGLINLEIGGPSVHPYQPPGYYANLQFPDRDYFPAKDDRQYRRGVYSWWQRTFLQPMLANFDAPAREECTAARNLSNTPQQALTLLNDPTYVEASRIFAAKVLSTKANTDGERLEVAFQRALARSVKPKERESLQKFLAEQREYYNANPADAKKLLSVGNAPQSMISSEPELAAWTQVCRVVLNLHEMITKY